jgi:hypothetical protein
MIVSKDHNSKKIQAEIFVLLSYCHYLIKGIYVLNNSFSFFMKNIMIMLEERKIR